MITVTGEGTFGEPGSDVQYRGLYYPDGDRITRHMAERLTNEPFYQSDKLEQAINVMRERYGDSNRWRTAVDCGAWVGGWSCELAKWFENVVAIEANPNNARCVRKNTPAHVRVIHTAVGDGLGTVLLDVAQANVGSTVGAAGVTVSICRLDDLGIKDVDYLKIHVNGMELKALRGAAETIRRDQPVLTVVLKPAIEQFGDSAEDARSFLQRLGYQPAGGERPYEIWAPA